MGTSGYSYPWNKGKPTPFAWYLGQGFETVEINASFYRFPSKTWIRAWEIAPAGFDFAIKVHRSITHFARLQGRALELFEKFRNTLKEIENKISFWLFQMPESFGANEQNLELVKDFFTKISLANKAVIEFREASWWNYADRVEKLGAVFCSVDAPDLPRKILSTNGVVYLRLHGRKAWYSWIYTDQELLEIAKKVEEAAAQKKYIFLNNDHGMIPNSKFLIKALESKDPGLGEKSLRAAKEKEGREVNRDFSFL